MAKDTQTTTIEFDHYTSRLKPWLNSWRSFVLRWVFYYRPCFRWLWVVEFGLGFCWRDRDHYESLVIVSVAVGCWVSKMRWDSNIAGFRWPWVGLGLFGFDGHELGLIVILSFKRVWATIEMALLLKMGLTLFGLTWVSRIHGMILLGNLRNCT